MQNHHHLTAAGIDERRAEIIAAFGAAIAAVDFAGALLVLAEKLDAHIDVLSARAQIGPKRYRPASARGLASAEETRVELLNRWRAARAASIPAAWRAA